MIRPRAWCVVPVLLFSSVALGQRERRSWVRAITLEPSKDNTLYESSLGQTSNGSGEHVFCGLTASGFPRGQIRRALLAFDIAGNLPADATILEVELTLHVTRTISGAQNVNLHLVLADWGEGASDALGAEGAGAPAAPGDATWLHTFSPGSLWATPGGDYAATPSASRTVGFFGPHAWSSPQLASDVQAWLDDPSTNFGWILIGAEPPTGFATAKRFGSSEGPRVYRPTLTITFRSRAMGACCFADGSCLTTTLGNCYTLGGDYQGDGSSCTPNPCPQPLGACCLPDSSCLQLTSEDCSAQGGTWQGPLSSCTPDPCSGGFAPLAPGAPEPPLTPPGAPGSAAGSRPSSPSPPPRTSAARLPRPG
jgi:hypothetical protein